MILFIELFFFLLYKEGSKVELLILDGKTFFEYDYYFLPNSENDEEQKIFLPPNVKEVLQEFRSDKGLIFESTLNPGQRISDAKRQTAKLKKKLGD